MNKYLTFFLFICVFSAIYFEDQVGKCGKGFMAPHFPYGIEIEWFSSVNGLTPLIVDADRFTLISEGGRVNILNGGQLLVDKVERYSYVDDLYFEVQGKLNGVYYLLFSGGENEGLHVNAFDASGFQVETGHSIKGLKWISLDPVECFANYVDLFRFLFKVLAVFVFVMLIYINWYLIRWKRP